MHHAEGEQQGPAEGGGDQLPQVLHVAEPEQLAAEPEAVADRVQVYNYYYNSTLIFLA